MPEFGVAMRKGPGNAVPAQAADDLLILINVLVVVEIDEVMAEGLPEDDPCKTNEDAAHD